MEVVLVFAFEPMKTSNDATTQLAPSDVTINLSPMVPIFITPEARADPRCIVWELVVAIVITPVPAFTIVIHCPATDTAVGNVIVNVPDVTRTKSPITAAYVPV